MNPQEIFCPNLVSPARGQTGIGCIVADDFLKDIFLLRRYLDRNLGTPNKVQKPVRCKGNVCLIKSGTNISLCRKRHGNFLKEKANKLTSWEPKKSAAQIDKERKCKDSGSIQITMKSISSEQISSVGSSNLMGTANFQCGIIIGQISNIERFSCIGYRILAVLCF
jgi:hypothetical protein